jgi:hypothetical protein
MPCVIASSSCTVQMTQPQLNYETQKTVVKEVHVPVKVETR